MIFAAAVVDVATQAVDDLRVAGVAKEGPAVRAEITVRARIAEIGGIVRAIMEVPSIGIIWVGLALFCAKDAGSTS